MKLTILALILWQQSARELFIQECMETAIVGGDAREYCEAKWDELNGRD